MTNLDTYRRSAETIGRMDTRAAIYTPVRTRSTTGGELISWVLWLTTWAQVKNVRASEDYESDRLTAFNTKEITVRQSSVPGVNETMAFQIGGEMYGIEAINPAQDARRGGYFQIVGIRADDNITPVTFLENNMYMAYSQTFANASGTSVTVTAGTMLSKDDYTEAQIHQLLFVFVSGNRRLYKSTADDGFDYNPDTGVVTFNSRIRGENVLIHQYSIT